VHIIQAAGAALALDPQRRLCVAPHEAGHELYARRAGAKDIVYHGPLEYPGRAGKIGEAGVQPVFSDTGVCIPLIAMARWFSAGSVVKRLLAPSFWEELELPAAGLHAFRHAQVTIAEREGGHPTLSGTTRLFPVRLSYGLSLS
jgi:hypothetical protein